MTSNEENDIWHAILKRDGADLLTKRILKLPSYRAYAQRFPLDGQERPLHLDYEVTIPGEGPMPFYDIVPDEKPNDLTAAIDDERVKAFKATLTPRQRLCLELQAEGYKSKEIYHLFGYTSTRGIRDLRWAIRRKYKAFVINNGG